MGPMHVYMHSVFFFFFPVLRTILCLSHWLLSHIAIVEIMAREERGMNPVINPRKPYLPSGDRLVGWLYWGLTPLLTAKVISWRSVTHMCFLAFSHQYQHKFLSKATDYFSHMIQQSREAKIRRKEISPQPGLEITATRS